MRQVVLMLLLIFCIFHHRLQDSTHIADNVAPSSKLHSAHFMHNLKTKHCTKEEINPSIEWPGTLLGLIAITWGRCSPESTLAMPWDKLKYMNKCPKNAQISWVMSLWISSTSPRKAFIPHCFKATTVTSKSTVPQWLLPYNTHTNHHDVLWSWVTSKPDLPLQWTHCSLCTAPTFPQRTQFLIRFTWH